MKVESGQVLARQLPVSQTKQVFGGGGGLGGGEEEGEGAGEEEEEVEDGIVTKVLQEAGPWPVGAILSVA